MKQNSRPGSFHLETASITHEGLVRKYNEDSIFANVERGIWVVADGMGGHKDGNVASAMIVDAARDIEKQSSMATLVADFRKRVAEVNERLLEISNGEDNALVGSTIAGLLVHEVDYTCLWAGDSRCYLARGGVLSQVTHDHTEVQELVDKALITQSEARTWPRRNVITRAVGADPDLHLDAVSGKLEAGDCFLLCSDGLTGHVEDSEILSSLTWSSPLEACQKLLALTLERGAKDNVSIIIISTSRHGANTVVQSW
jgi:serine/threonine protein phosphatase PrpC